MSAKSPRKRTSKSASNGKLGHVSNQTVLLSSLLPAYVNDQIYKPVDATDPETIELAASVRDFGLKEPIVVTLDHVILSGHRRRVACQLAGVKRVPVRYEPIYSTDPEFPRLLVEYNRQRVKSLDEQLREEVVAADPEDAYRLLTEHRQKAARVDLNTIEIRGRKHRSEITAAKEPFLQAIDRVLHDLADYLPLSDRQIHYQLLNSPPLIHARKRGSTYRNDLQSYKALCELLTRARLAGRIPFEAIADPTRPVTTWRVFRQPQPFIREEIDNFLKGYYRDLMQSQPNHIEIIGEKNTIESVIRPVSLTYCIPYTIGRGYCSLPPRYEMAQRYRRSGKEKLILIAVSDFDPEGDDIPHSFARSMRDDFGIDDVEVVKAALTGDQVREMQLPPGLKAKAKSSRRKHFVREHGEHVYELEAVQPGRLEAILRGVIDSVIDVDLFNAEVDAEKQDSAFLDGVRQQVHRAIGPLLTE